VAARKTRLLVVLAVAVGGYHWLGAGIVAVGFISFMLYELLMPPPRYRRFGLDQIQQAVDNRFGQFGRTYRKTKSIENLPRRWAEMIIVPVAAA
jgi:hypothetical protein